MGGTTAPAAGRCAVTSSVPGARVQWGEVATGLVSTAQAPTTAFLSCLDAWYTLPGGQAFEVGLLIDARSPGARPPALWGSQPLAGHPGLVMVPPYYAHFVPIPRAATERMLAALRRRDGAAAAQDFLRQSVRAHAVEPAVVGRRVGAGWLVVRNGGTIAAGVRDLDALRLARLDLRSGGR